MTNEGKPPPDEKLPIITARKKTEEEETSKVAGESAGTAPPLNTPEGDILGKTDS